MTAAMLGVGVLALQSEPAHAFDMDCKVILCLAGGFPAGCGDAYSYMIDRITRFPKPLPPFGFCAMSDGSEYTAHNVSYRYLHRGPDAYDCAAGTQLFYRRNDEERGFGNETAFCKITVEPGTAHEFRSPLFRINYGTGYFSQRQS